ncbi:uncharacterized protein EDB91DRAFT_1042259 [Suillus paluster]|uniref:uncharacterized protein n=1 Tax=Suillus paluster TaxID=48578 RepID=UPI001B86F3F2|nr:uncharacterized protein EDB91DRAFT_1042259 [Suillus paluster]KAG1754924.1 hypothetical protein EDB91DRAFT_1042259 [Suillus paluster]
MSPSQQPTVKIWWSNATFFVSTHIAAVICVYLRPPTTIPRETLLMAFLLWQLADFGITIGYHRLWSHRTFRANLYVRVVLAALGSSAFQGSIKWWCVHIKFVVIILMILMYFRCLRHRLHHRFTDDLQHDPYAATRGLFYSHMGWIFFKPVYERVKLVDREDLDRDPVVRFQHEHYVPLAIVFGYAVPVGLGSLWRDPVGAFIYGGLVTRLAVWHCTFLVNSLAHWDGPQPYSDEDTSRGNIVLAILTGGEGNHNFVCTQIHNRHAFPHDYRSGPSRLDWDPSKWIIAALHFLGLIQSVRRARPEDINEARFYMHHKNHGIMDSGSDNDWSGEEWNCEQARTYITGRPGACLLVIDGFLVDVSVYLGEHPGGAALLRDYSRISLGDDGKETWRDSSWAFGGGLNNHGRAAKRKMGELRVAKISDNFYCAIRT